MKILLWVLFLFFLLPMPVQSADVDGDLTLAQYRQIEIALGQGDESKLPGCTQTICARDFSHLINSLKYRIYWKLDKSLTEARECEALSRDHHVATHYVCSRLMMSDAQALEGLYGLQATMPTLVSAVEQACKANLWGNKGSCTDSPVALQATKLSSLTLAKEVIDYNSTDKSVVVIGDGRVQSLVDDGTSKTKNIEFVVTYPTVHAKVNGKDVLLTIDSGAQNTVLFSASAKRVGLSELKGTEKSIRGITGAMTVEHVEVAKSFEFANLRIQNKYIEVGDNGASLPTDGLIGLDILDKLGSFLLTKNAFIVSPAEPPPCAGRFTVSTDAYSLVNGIVAKGTTFNGVPVVAVLDTGNAAAKVSPTWQLVSRLKLPTTNPHRSYSFAGTSASLMQSADIHGSLSFLGKEQTDTFSIGANAPGIDFNIGAPFFYGDDLYIDFNSNKICLVRH